MRPMDAIFIQEYMKDFDAKNAALRAGFKLSTAKDAYKWISDEKPTKPAVKNAIEKMIAERSRHAGANKTRILDAAACTAFANIADIIDFENGRLKENIPREAAMAIASVKTKYGRDGRVIEQEVRLNDRSRALELIGKGEKVFEDKLKIDGQIPIVITGGDLLED